ncbi:MAG: hypothetical protein OXG46_14380 [Chloroflexi bacterium]|nr:hypothetical protein [Chloroflexota bacterium]MCY3939071.1 hypothetical protein [Chloroflexota bacterium]
MRPVVRGLMDKYQGQVQFLILDYDDRSLNEVRQRFRVTSHPAFAVVTGNLEIVRNWIGPAPSFELEEAIVEALEG